MVEQIIILIPLVIFMIVIGANLQQILTDLKNIVHSPIKPYVSQDESIQDSLTTPNDVSDDDLACLINRIMGRRKFHISILFMSRHYHGFCILSLIEREAV